MTRSRQSRVSLHRDLTVPTRAPRTHKETLGSNRDIKDTNTIPYSSGYIFISSSPLHLFYLPFILFFLSFPVHLTCSPDGVSEVLLLNPAFFPLILIRIYVPTQASCLPSPRWQLTSVSSLVSHKGSSRCMKQASLPSPLLPFRNTTRYI